MSDQSSNSKNLESGGVSGSFGKEINSDSNSVTKISLVGDDPQK